MGPNDEESAPFIYVCVCTLQGTTGCVTQGLQIFISQKVNETLFVFFEWAFLSINSHWVAVASGGTEELVVSFDAGHSSDDLAANLQTQRQRQCSPHDLKQCIEELVLNSMKLN